MRGSGPISAVDNRKARQTQITFGNDKRERQKQKQMQIPLGNDKQSSNGKGEGKYEDSRPSVQNDVGLLGSSGGRLMPVDGGCVGGGWCGW